MREPPLGDDASVGSPAATFEREPPLAHRIHGCRQLAHGIHPQILSERGLAAGTFEYRRRGESENRSLSRDEVARLFD